MQPQPTPSPSPSPTPKPEGAVAVPAPVQGASVVLQPVRGTVTYRVPGSSTDQKVASAASIPTGSIVDTTKGTVALTSKVNGTEQIGRFNGGEFKVKQVKATGMTQLYLTAPLDCGKATTSKKATRSAARKGKKRRHVWGEDKNGRFETHGRDSVATVRGTKWLTTDTCGGTVVKGFEGAVSVSPRRGKGKAVVVKAGGRHVTRPAK